MRIGFYLKAKMYEIGSARPCERLDLICYHAGVLDQPTSSVNMQARSNTHAHTVDSCL